MKNITVTIKYIYDKQYEEQDVKKKYFETKQTKTNTQTNGIKIKRFISTYVIGMKRRQKKIVVRLYDFCGFVEC